MKRFFSSGLYKTARWTLVLMLAFTACCKPEPVPETFFICGVDLSKLPELEEEGVAYYNFKDVEQPALDIFKAEGVNTVRMRLWVHPSGNHSTLAEVNAFSKRVHQAGLKVWLDLHYSDTWADPGKQYKPAVWRGLGFKILEDIVFRYTLRVINRIRPEYVQVGNEINNGFLWDDGSILHPVQFTGLLKKAVAAVRQADPETKVLLHYAGYKGAEWFFGLLKKYGVDYDLIGLSYYPWWHGKSLDTLQMVVNQL